jgi:Endonuclease/Exonuclease/phosphatase family
MVFPPIAFWNVERLFEADSHIAAALGGADAQPPDAAVTTLKLRVLGAVIADFAAAHGTPALLGIAEIESTTLVRRLLTASQLGLRSIEGAVPDEMGVVLEGLDITLYYDPAVFDPPTRIRSHVLDRTFDTRDVLEVELPLRSTGTTVLVLVNHWPSRLVSESADRRVNTAYYVRQLVSERVRFQPRELWNAVTRRLVIPPRADLVARAARPVVLMGDFNDEPFDRTMEILATTAAEDEVANDLHVRGRSNRDRYTTYVASTPKLFNPYWSMCTGAAGTYYRSPRWRIYDQVMLSRGALDTFGPKDAYLHAPATVTLDARQVPMLTRFGRPLSFDAQRMTGASDHLFTALLDRPGG